MSLRADDVVAAAERIVAGVTVELLEGERSELSVVDLAIDDPILCREAAAVYLAAVDLLGRVVADASHVLALDRTVLTARLGQYVAARRALHDG